MVAVFMLGAVLALDAAAVTAGLGAAQQPLARLACAASLFGLFQAAMSGAGALGGAWLTEHLGQYDHWIAFVLLTGVGARMLWVAGEPDDEDHADVSLATLVVLAFATSVDALAAGVTLPLLGPPLWVSALAIGVITAAMSMAAGVAARSMGAALGPMAERMGGLVLVGLGVKVLVEHWLV